MKSDGEPVPQASFAKLDIHDDDEEQRLKLLYDRKCLNYTKRNPRSKENYNEACKHMPGGNTRTVLHVAPFPLTVQYAERFYIKTLDGLAFNDFLGEYTAGIFGHDNATIKKAVQDALHNGWNYGANCLMEQKLAKTVCERFPDIRLVRFVNSGTEANTMAIATAVVHTRKKTILIFDGAYHGGTISGKVEPDKANINLPHKFVIGRYNDLKGTRNLIDAIKHDLAAILVEPMMGSGGCFAATNEFLQLLRTLSSRCGALLIFDEVMTSRLAYHGLGHSHGVIPDLMTLGKWVGGGMTFGAFGGRADLMSMYDPRIGNLNHAGTFNNNVFTMTAGVAGCKLLTEDRLQELNSLGDRMRRAIEKVLRKHRIEGTIPNAPLRDPDHPPEPPNRPPKMFITGVGSLMNIHFAGPHRRYLQGIYYFHMLESGFYIAPRGFIALSIEITQDLVNRFVNDTDEFCQRYLEALKWPQ